MATVGSPSIEHPGYWWYRARGELLRVALQKYVAGNGRLLDVGSADGPSVGWLRDRGHRVALDVDPRGLGPGDVCGSVTRLPFVDGHRRYTRPRAVAAVRDEGLEVLRASYIFTGTFPFFAADRLRTRWRERRSPATDPAAGAVPELPSVSPAVERLLLGATRVDRALLGRGDLPFGSSVVVAARKPSSPDGGRDRAP